MPCQTVILRHQLPDGSVHYDWLLAIDHPATKPLMSWRCVKRPDFVRVGGVVSVQRMEDHRPIYLEYEGPISGDRGSGSGGSVERLAEGWWSPIGEMQCGTGPMPIAVQWLGGMLREHWVIRAHEAGRTQ